MERDFSKNGLEYNEGFIDGLLWVFNGGNGVEFNEILPMAVEIMKANDEIINDEERYLNS